MVKTVRWTVREFSERKLGKVSLMTDSLRAAMLRRLVGGTDLLRFCQMLLDWKLFFLIYTSFYKASKTL